MVEQLTYYGSLGWVLQHCSLLFGTCIGVAETWPATKGLLVCRSFMGMETLESHVIFCCFMLVFWKVMIRKSICVRFLHLQSFEISVLSKKQTWVIPLQHWIRTKSISNTPMINCKTWRVTCEKPPFDHPPVAVSRTSKFVVVHEEWWQRTKPWLHKNEPGMGQPRATGCWQTMAVASYVLVKEEMVRKSMFEKCLGPKVPQVAVPKRFPRAGREVQGWWSQRCMDHR